MLDGASQILFAVNYSVNSSEDERALFRYSIPKNETEVEGYFIEGTNILKYFKNNSDESKP